MRRISLFLALATCALAACNGESDRYTSTRGIELPGATEATRTPADTAAPGFDGLEGFLDKAAADKILARTERVTIQADTATLTDGERAALQELMKVGDIFQRLYEDSGHAEAGRVDRHLATYEPANDAERAHLAALRDLYRLFRGPIARTLDNKRVPLAPIADYSPGRNVYPPETEAKALQAYAKAHENTGLLEVRTVVRRRTDESLDADRRLLKRYPALATLHPDFVARLEAAADPDGWYGAPYAVAYAEEMLESHNRLRRASELVRADDEDLADYLEQRGRDLLTNDYEAGDAAWVSGRMKRLNAEIGAYETYDDHLLGLRGFFALSILVRDAEASAELEQAVAHLPAFEEALPGGPYGRVRPEIPIGIFDVHADYGQCRGANTASILPNESHIVRRYGRIILIRRNILTNPALFGISQQRFRAALAEAHENDLGEQGKSDRTIFHEVGHYLGPKRTEDNRLITEALGNLQNTIEELKSDLISLWLMPRLVELGVLSAERARSAYASGVLRVLLPVEPRREQSYGIMQLMQQNYFLEQGLLRFDAEAGELHIDYDRYPQVVEAMLTEVLQLQRGGDRAAVEAFVDRWARWDAEVQGVIGRAVDEAAPRFRLVSYTAFDEN